MKLLITGGCGFIGTNLVQTLLRETDHHIVNLDKLTYAANPVRDVGSVFAQRYRLIQADIAQSAAVHQAIAECQPDAILHLAAESHVDRSIDSPADFIQTNLVGTFNLLDASYRYWRQLTPAAQTAFRFLHISTDEVYGSLGPTGLFTENSPYDPHSPYAATKAGADHLARAWHDTYGLPVIVTNCSNNYGPYQFPEKLIPLMIIKAVREQSLPVYGQGANVRDWLYVEDHVRALLLTLSHGRPGETYNIGGNCQRRNIDLVHYLCTLLDEVRPRAGGGRYADLITFVPDRPGHDQRYAIDATKIQRELGWQPLADLETHLRHTLEWYLAHETWWQSILEQRYQLQRLGQQASGEQV
jgi:dTDP-glucose 4,6-dehydratase